jgi:hypothetical protein
MAPFLLRISGHMYSTMSSFLRQGSCGAPFTRVMGKRGGVTHLRVFGYYCLVRSPPGKCSAKLSNHITLGQCLGYTGTLNQIYYLDLTINRIKSAFSARFDESEVGLVPPTPNTLQLCAALDGKDLPATDHEIRAPNELRLVIKNSPFVEMKQFDLQVCYDNPTFVMRVDFCSCRGRIYVSSTEAHSTGVLLHGWR